MVSQVGACLPPPDQRLMARPPARAGRRKWFVDGRRETERLFSAFSQDCLPHPQPAGRWAGRYEPFAGRAAGQVSRKRYSLPHTTPPEKGVRGKNLFPLGFFPHFFPKWGPGWKQPSFPPVLGAKRLPPKSRKPEGNLNPPQKQPSPTISCVAFLSPPHPLPGEN